MYQDTPTQDCRFPLPTGRAAELLGTTEPRLAEAVRRGRVCPPPPILAGRRLWDRDHLIQAATYLGLMRDELRAILGTDLSSTGKLKTDTRGAGE